MLTCSVIKYGTIFIFNQNFRVFTAQPYRWSCRRSTHNDFQIIFGSQSHRFIQPGKIIFSLFRFQLRPSKFREMGEFKTQIVHLFKISLPLTLIPMLRIIISTGQGQILVFKPRLLCKKSSGQRTSQKNGHKSFFHDKIVI